MNKAGLYRRLTKKMGHPIPKEIILETEDCCNCGILFALPDYLMKRLKKNGGFFYCPNGHQQYYTHNKEMKEKLQDQIKETTKLAGQLHKVKLEIKRMKKRSSVGVCPCCNRTFKQLAKHMKNKHPEY